MPMPTMADNPIFQPGSGFFSWQKIIDANKDQSQKAGEEYNKSLTRQADEASKKQEATKRALSAVQTDINTSKQDVANYVSGGLKGAESADKRKQIGEIAQKGYQFDANPFQQNLQNFAKNQADIKAARSVAGRMGLQSGQMPSQAGLFDQMYLAQGGAGQDADLLAERLSNTSEMLKNQIGQTSKSAAELQKDVVPQLVDYAKQLRDPARAASIQKGRDVIGSNLAQAKGMADLTAFGDVEKYKQAGIDLNKYIKTPDVNTLSEDELMAYGAPQSDEYQTLQDTYKMLGIPTDELPDAKSYSLDYNINDAKSVLDLVDARRRGGRELGFNTITEEQKKAIEDQRRADISKKIDEKKEWDQKTGFGSNNLFEKTKNW